MNRYSNGCKFQSCNSHIQLHCTSVFFFYKTLHLLSPSVLPHLLGMRPWLLWVSLLGLLCLPALDLDVAWGHLSGAFCPCRVLQVSYCLSLCFKGSISCSSWKVLGTGNLNESTAPALRIPSSQKDPGTVALRGLAVPRDFSLQTSLLSLPFSQEYFPTQNVS